MRNGAAIQSALAFTGATSVPRVFIGGKFVGGALRLRHVPWQVPFPIR